MASMTSPDHANINMDPPDGDIEAVVGSFLNLPAVPALAQPTAVKATSADQDASTGETSSDDSESGDEGDDGGEQMDLMLAVLRLLQKEKPKKKKAGGAGGKGKSKSKSNSKAGDTAALMSGGGSAKDQKQLLTVLSKALSTMDAPEDEEPATSAPKLKRAKLSADGKSAGSRQMPQLARSCAEAAAPAQQKGNGAGCGAEGGEDTNLRCFMDQLPQIDGHLDAMIAAVADAPPQEAQPSPTEHVSSSAGASARGCSAERNARDDGAGSGSRFPQPHTPHFSGNDRQQTGSWDAVSSSSMDSSAAAAAAAAAAALAVNSRKRKSAEDEGACAGGAGNEQAAISSRSASEGRWNGNGQAQECQQYRPLSLPHATSNGPVVVSRQQLQQSACKPPLLSLPAVCLAAPGAGVGAPLLRAPASNASAASAPPPPATPLRLLTVPADVSPTAAPTARPNVMERFSGVREDLSAEQPLGFPVRFGSRGGDEAGNQAAGMGSHGYNEDVNGCDDGGMGYDDMGADDMDDWMPRSRGRKDRQVAGGRIKARSMAERQRRERISEGLQKLRMAVRGHGDTATMLDNAVAYVQALQRRVTSLETNLLLHQASCGGIGQAGAALGGCNGSNSNNRGRHANGFVNPSQFGSLFSLDV
ncbi:hypothetical protein CLOM_g15332 [Closterium sp. NIES-68]|nr:hypothetical protein CLOM_g15332 [Closterium sp. NIES-68]GJP61363.1 hypothetical protein CLOP_g18534 [Closterium sp. NIES-67]